MSIHEIKKSSLFITTYACLSIWLAKDCYVAHYNLRIEGCQKVCNYAKWGKTRGDLKGGMQGKGGTTFGKTLPPPNHHHHHQGAPQPVCGLTGLFLANLPLTTTPNIVIGKRFIFLAMKNWQFNSLNLRPRFRVDRLLPRKKGWNCDANI